MYLVSTWSLYVLPNIRYCIVGVDFVAIVDRKSVTLSNIMECASDFSCFSGHFGPTSVRGEKFRQIKSTRQ